MKFTLKREEVLKAMRILKASTVSSDRALVYYKSVRVNVLKGKLLWRATDGMVLSCYVMNVDPVPEDFDALFTFGPLLHVLEESSTPNVEFEQINTKGGHHHWKIRTHGTYRFTVSSLEAYPPFPLRGEPLCSIEIDPWVRALDRCFKAVAPESDNRMHLQGVLWNGEWVAADGRWLVRVTPPGFQGVTVGPYLMPRALLNGLSMFSGRKGEIHHMEDRALIFRLGDVFFSGRLYAGVDQFPNYGKRVEELREQNTRLVTVDRSKFLETLKRMEVFKDDNSMAELTVTDDSLNVKIGKDTEGQEALPAGVQEASGMSVYLNIENLTECLKMTGQEKNVTLCLGAGTDSPVLVEGELPTKELVTTVMMPYKKG